MFIGTVLLCKQTEGRNMTLTGRVVDVRGDKGKGALLNRPLARGSGREEGAGKGKCPPGGWGITTIP